MRSTHTIVCFAQKGAKRGWMMVLALSRYPIWHPFPHQLPWNPSENPFKRHGPSPVQGHVSWWEEKKDQAQVWCTEAFFSEVQESRLHGASQQKVDVVSCTFFRTFLRRLPDFLDPQAWPSQRLIWQPGSTRTRQPCMSLVGFVFAMLSVSAVQILSLAPTWFWPPQRSPAFSELWQEGFPLFDSYTYVLAGDGCLMEGVSSEAASLAGESSSHVESIAPRGFIR